jgi:hypothetical protein
VPRYRVRYFQSPGTATSSSSCSRCAVRSLWGRNVWVRCCLPSSGCLKAVPACTDLTTKQWVIEAGVSVIDQPFHARGRVATAGGCLASQYLATWIILRLGSREGVATALHRVSPVGQQAEYIARAIEAVQPYLPPGLPLPPPQSEPLPPLASPFRGRARVDLPNT